MLLITNFVNDLTVLVEGAGISPLVFLLGVVVLYLVLGMFMEALSMMVVTIPFLFPIAQALGIHPVWFGVLIVKLSELAVITPPVGINLFTVVSASDGKVGVRAIYVGVLPFVLIDFLVLGILFDIGRVSCR